MKQTVTFDRVQSVTLEFDLEQPMTEQHAAFWANYEGGGKAHLDAVAAGGQGAGFIRVDKGQWKPTTAQPDFAPAEVKAKVKRVRKALRSAGYPVRQG
jgi:hypothetical protein